MNSMEDFFDTTAEEAEAALEKFDNGRKRDGRVCICGHSVGRHEDLGDGIINCRVVKYECPCTGVRVVLDASNTRPFIRTTDGPGVQHALLKGVAAANKAGATFEWIAEPICDKCSREGKILPAALNPSTLRISNMGTRLNQMLCRECIVELS